VWRGQIAEGWRGAVLRGLVPKLITTAPLGMVSSVMYESILFMSRKTPPPPPVKDEATTTTPPKSKVLESVRGGRVASIKAAVPPPTEGRSR
jgi:hypothetical protein